MPACEGWGASFHPGLKGFAETQPEGGWCVSGRGSHRPLLALGHQGGSCFVPELKDPRPFCKEMSEIRLWSRIFSFNLQNSVRILSQGLRAKIFGYQEVYIYGNTICFSGLKKPGGGGGNLAETVNVTDTWHCSWLVEA